MSTPSVAERVLAAVAAGKPREGLEILVAAKAPIDPGLAPIAAEAFAAVGQERRAAALLYLAARRHGGDRGLALEAARALLRRGQHRRAGRVLAAHAASAPVLVAVASRAPVPAPSPTDVQDEIDHALATATTTTALGALLERAPTSARLRIALAARALDEQRGADARAILRAGLQGREDARLELALATVAVATGTWDEAAVVIARARSRFPRLARDPALLTLLGLVTVAAGRRDDAISVLHGGGRAPMTAAFQALLAPTPKAMPATTKTATATATPPTTAAPAPARPMSALMQETLARAGAAVPASQPVGGPMPGSGAGAPTAVVPPATTPAMTPPPTTTPPTAPTTTAPTTTAATTTAATTTAPTAPKSTAPPTTTLDPASPRPAPGSTAPPRSTTAPTFRRIEAQPEASGRRGALGLVAVLVLLVGGPLRWCSLTAKEEVANENADRTVFAAQLERCGLDVEPWIAIDVAPDTLAADAARTGWRNHPASVPSEKQPVDPAIQPGVALLPLRTGATLEAALVVTPGRDRVLGLAWTTSTERPLVSSLFGALKFDSAQTRPCALPGGQCVVGVARCEDLAIRVQALCAGPTTASLLSRCALDTAIIGPAALLPPPAPPTVVPTVGSSLSGTDLVVPVSEP